MFEPNSDGRSILGWAIVIGAIVLLLVTNANAAQSTRERSEGNIIYVAASLVAKMTEQQKTEAKAWALANGITFKIVKDK